MTIAASIVRFKREEKSEPEIGIAIIKAPGLYDCVVIVTDEGKELHSVWKFWLLPDYGAFTIPIQVDA